MAVTLPAGLPLGQRVTLAAGKRLILIDATGETPADHLLEFLIDQVEPAFRSDDAGNAPTPRVINPASEIQIVEFSVDGASYGIDARLVREVIAARTLTVVPGTPASVIGVISRGGQVFPVVDLRRWFNLGEVADSQAKRIIVVTSQAGDLGFLVDSVADVRQLAAAMIEPPSAALACTVSEYLIGFVEAEHGLITILDVEGMAARAAAG